MQKTIIEQHILRVPIWCELCRVQTICNCQRVPMSYEPSKGQPKTGENTGCIIASVTAWGRKKPLGTLLIFIHPICFSSFSSTLCLVSSAERPVC